MRTPSLAGVFVFEPWLVMGIGGQVLAFSSVNVPLDHRSYPTLDNSKDAVRPFSLRSGYPYHDLITGHHLGPVAEYLFTRVTSSLTGNLHR